MKLRILCRDLSMEEWSDHIHGAVRIEGILESWRTPKGWQVNMLVSYDDSTVVADKMLQSEEMGHNG